MTTQDNKRIKDLVEFLFEHSDDYDSCMIYMDENEITIDEKVRAIDILEKAFDEFTGELQEEILEELCQKCG